MKIYRYCRVYSVHSDITMIITLSNENLQVLMSVPLEVGLQKKTFEN